MKLKHKTGVQNCGGPYWHKRTQPRSTMQVKVPPRV